MKKITILVLVLSALVGTVISRHHHHHHHKGRSLSGKAGGCSGRRHGSKTESKIEEKVKPVEDTRSVNTAVSLNVKEVEFVQIGTKYYWINTAQPMNWHAAHHTCRRNNAQLATIESEAEFKALVGALNSFKKDRKRFWIAGNDLAEENKFLWDSNGQPMNYSKWSPGQPDNHKKNENCVELWVHNNEYMMNDLDCALNLNFICEADLACGSLSAEGLWIANWSNALTGEITGEWNSNGYFSSGGKNWYRRWYYDVKGLPRWEIVWIDDANTNAEIDVNFERSFEESQNSNNQNGRWSWSWFSQGIPDGFNMQDMWAKWRAEGGNNFNFDEWLIQWKANGGNAADFEEMVKKFKSRFGNGGNGKWSWSWHSRGVPSGFNMEDMMAKWKDQGKHNFNFDAWLKQWQSQGGNEVDFEEMVKNFKTNAENSDNGGKWSYSWSSRGVPKGFNMKDMMGKWRAQGGHNFNFDAWLTQWKNQGGSSNDFEEMVKNFKTRAGNHGNSKWNWSWSSRGVPSGFKMEDMMAKWKAQGGHNFNFDAWLTQWKNQGGSSNGFEEMVKNFKTQAGNGGNSNWSWSWNSGSSGNTDAKDSSSVFVNQEEESKIDVVVHPTIESQVNIEKEIETVQEPQVSNGQNGQWSWSWSSQNVPHGFKMEDMMAKWAAQGGHNFNFDEWLTQWKAQGGNSIEFEEMMKNFKTQAKNLGNGKWSWSWSSGSSGSSEGSDSVSINQDAEHNDEVVIPTIDTTSNGDFNVDMAEDFEVVEEPQITNGQNGQWSWSWSSQNMPRGFKMEDMMAKWAAQGGHNFNFDEWLTQWKAQGGDTVEFEEMMNNFKTQAKNLGNGKWSWSYSSDSGANANVEDSGNLLASHEENSDIDIVVDPTIDNNVGGQFEVNIEDNHEVTQESQASNEQNGKWSWSWSSQGVPSGFNMQDMMAKWAAQGGKNFNFDDWSSQWKMHGGNTADFEEMVKNFKAQAGNKGNGKWSYSWSSKGVPSGFNMNEMMTKWNSEGNNKFDFDKWSAQWRAQGGNTLDFDEMVKSFKAQAGNGGNGKWSFSWSGTKGDSNGGMNAELLAKLQEQFKNQAQNDGRWSWNWRDSGASSNNEATATGTATGNMGFAVSDEPNVSIQEEQVIETPDLQVGTVTGGYNNVVETDYPDIALKNTEFESDKRYYVYWDKKNWFNADRACRDMGLQLATISNEADYDRINGFLKVAAIDAGVTDTTLNAYNPAVRFYFAGNDLGQEGKFFHITNGKPMTYFKWSRYQPDNHKGNEDCLQLWIENGEYLMNDGMCLDEFHYICEDTDPCVA